MMQQELNDILTPLLEAGRASLVALSVEESPELNKVSIDLTLLAIAITEMMAAKDDCSVVARLDQLAEHLRSSLEYANKE